MKKLVLLLCSLCFLQILCLSETEIEKTFKLLEQGENVIELTNKKDVVLVFGATGSGKTTFIQWIAGDNTNLISVETYPGSEEYLIEDTNDKIGSSTVSKTLFPELVTDDATGTTFYDFPGFSDTRSSSHDIAASFFMKTVMDHVENVKMLFMTSYHTVQEGLDRSAFTGLLKNIVDMIGDVDKFEKSIALVVTKVDNSYSKKGILKPDSTVIKGIAKFLVSTRQVYEDDLEKTDISDKKRRFNENAIKVINILLTQDDGEYTHITLFRRPDEEGLLSESELLLEGKEIVRHVISENLRFSHTDPDDFGFTISDNSKLEIGNLVAGINDQITGIIEEIAANIKTNLKTFVEPVRAKIEAGNLEALQFSKANEFSAQAKNDEAILNEAVNFFENMKNINGLGETLTTYLSELRLEQPAGTNQVLLKLGKYFEFFQLFKENPLPMSSLSWTKSFQSVLSYLTDSKLFIRDKASVLAERINSELTSDVESIAGDVKTNFMNDVDRMAKIIKSLTDNSTTVEVDPLEAKAFHKKLMTGEEFLTELVEKAKAISKPQTLSDEISKALSSMNFELPIDVLSNIYARSKEFEILEVVSGNNFGFPSAQWSNAFKTVVTYIQTQNILTLVAHAQAAIATNVDSLMKDLTENIRSIADKKSLELEVDHIGEEFGKWRKLFASIRDNFEEETTLNGMIEALSTTLLALEVNERSLHTYLGTLDSQEKYLGFLKALKGESTDVIATPSGKAYISDLMAYFDSQLEFNTFVMSLFEKLSQFDIQKDVSRYDVLDLSHWGVAGKPQGIHVDKNNFKLFMEKVKNFNIEAADKIQNIVPSELQISILNNVLKVTLKKRVVTQCPTALNSAVVLKANFIKFSDFLDSNGIFKGCGWGNTKSLEVHALNTLFIDQDLSAIDHRLQLSIVAPKWEVIGKRKITLDGKAGQLLPKAADGQFPSGHGQNGLPGTTGGSAGALFGVVTTFINSENLAITANGGNGAPGQSGGNGARGQDGATPGDVSGNCDIGAYHRAGFNTVDQEKWNCGTGRCHNHKIFGHDATNGGNAGSCGVGGLGGFSGQISVISLTQPSMESKIAVDGNRGANGNPGAVGAGGQHGSHRKVSCRRAWGKKSFSRRSSSLEGRGPAASGVPSSGCNAKLPENPLPAVNVEAASSLRNFVEFFIENSGERFVRHSALEVYEHINAHPQIEKLRDTLGLIEDLKMLEGCAQNRDLNLVPFYESHLTNIENYAAKPKTTETSTEFKKVLSYLYTTALTQISNLKKSQDSDLVIDVSGYLDIVAQNVKTLSTLQDESRLVSVVETLKNNFKDEIDKKINEAKGLIEIVIVPEIDNLGYQLDSQMTGLIQEVVALQSQANQDITALEAQKQRLKQSMKNKILGTALKVVSMAAAYFVPAGSVVGQVIEKGTAVAGSLGLETPKLGSGDIKATAKEIGKSLVDFSKSLKSNQNSIRQVTQGIHDLEKVLKELENFEAKIFEKLIPMIEKMGNDLIKTANNLESKSNVALDVVGWQVQGTLRDTSLEIQQFTRGFKVEGSVAKLIEKLEEAMTTLIKVYDRIQDFQEQQKLATYMADLSSASARQIIVSNPLISNGFRDLQISIRSNIVLNQYNSVLNAFKQWIFPFAEVFLKDFQLPENLVSSNTELEALASAAGARIEEIRSRIQKYKTTIEDFDKHLYRAQFNGSLAVMKPFYVWKNDEHREMITKLLAGESVLVKADITHSAAGKDAIKFNYVELGFKSVDSTIQTEINQNLLNFGIKMTHLGNSFYRYNGQYFSIPSSSQSMHYSFEKLADGTAVYGNNVYHKLLSGDIMLSPYTMWELQLTLDNSKAVKSFSALSKFWDKVDLVFEGSGSFVNTGETKFDVESYYKIEDSIKLLKD